MINKKIGKSYLSRVRRLSGNETPSFMKRAVAIVKYQERVNSLKAKGAIPFTENGFEKISWDMFQKTEEPDFGSIWVVTTIKNANDEDEKWLVVNVDDNDKIIRSVKASIKKAQTMTKEDPNYTPGCPACEEALDMEATYEDAHFSDAPDYWDLIDTARERTLLKQCIEKYNKKKEASITKKAQEEDYIPFKEGDRVRTFTDQEGEVVSIAENTIRVILDGGNEVIRYTPRELTKISKKISHTPGAIVQVVIPQGGINEKYNGKVGEVVAAIPDRSKISFKDMPSLWFEDNTIKVVASCNVCGSDVSLQSLKKLGKVECKCGAFYNWRQLEKIAKTAAVNERAIKKIKIAAVRDIDELSDDLIFDFDDYLGWVDKEGSYEKALEQWLRVRKYTLTEDEIQYLLRDIKQNAKDIGLEDREKEAFIKKAKIVEKGDEFCVEAESGRSMGCYSTKAKAEKRLKQVEMFKHMKESKKAQNVIFWFDDPKALKNLRYLQGPPTSPAGEEELLEKPGLEEGKLEVAEVEKEASKKTAQEEFKVGDWVLFQKEADGEEFEGKIIDFDTEPGHVIIEDEEGQYWTHVDNLKKSGKRSLKKTLRIKKGVRNFEVGDSVQIMDKEGNTNVVPEATIAQVDEYLGEDGQMHETVEVTDSANEDEQMWYGEEEYQVILLDPIEASKKKKTKVSTEIKKEAREKIGSIVKEGLEKTAQELLKGDRVNHYKHGPGYIDHIDGTTYSIPMYIIKLDSGDEIAVPKGEIEKISSKKKEALVKKAQGGGQFEMLRGGGGGSQDQLEPMGWNVQESKTPELPEQAEEIEEIEEEIVIRIDPSDKSVSVNFEGEKEKEEERVEEMKGAEAPPEKPVEKPKEGPEEEGLEEVPVNF